MCRYLPNSQHSRNLLNYESSGQADTRVYAVNKLDIGPPSPPGYKKDSIKHFSILKEPSPPPPPQPPPSPPHEPPPPLPAALGTRTETHVECEFFEGMDAIVSDSMAASIDTTAESKHHCCSRCGVQPGCTDFVYEPTSKVCVLLPSVPGYRLKRTPNNSTVAGSIRISHLSNHHATCHFNIGSGYAGSAIGVGLPLQGRIMKNRQDCCDACERDGRCAKFMFEHYSGDCQLFGPEAEQYFTFSLLSGYVDARVSHNVALDAMPHRDYSNEILHDAATSHEDDFMHDYWSDSTPVTDTSEPPLPPAFMLLTHLPPPPLPSAEAGMAATVLADFSLAIGFLMAFGFCICSLLFFGHDLSILLYRYTNGLLGKLPSKSFPALVPLESAETTCMHVTSDALKPGWAKVTVQTTQLTQKKDVNIGDCLTLHDFQELVWEEFAHLLKKVRVKDVALLVWASDGAPARWMLVTEASDMSRVSGCAAMKLCEKHAIETNNLAVAFTLAIGSANGDRAKTAHRVDMLHDRSKNAIALNTHSGMSDDERDPSARASISSWRRNHHGCFKHGSAKGCMFGASTADDDSASGHDDAEPLCSLQHTPRGGFRLPTALVRNSQKLKSSEESGRRATSKANRRRSGAGARNASASRCPTEHDAEHSTGQQEEHSDDDLDASLNVMHRELVGEHVKVVGLTSKAYLNGESGTVMAFDSAKRRYRVRLDAPRAGHLVLAFKVHNLQLSPWNDMRLEARGRGPGEIS